MGLVFKDDNAEFIVRRRLGHLDFSANNAVVLRFKPLNQRVHVVLRQIKRGDTSAQGACAARHRCIWF